MVPPVTEGLRERPLRNPGRAFDNILDNPEPVGSLFVLEATAAGGGGARTENSVEPPLPVPAVEMRSIDVYADKTTRRFQMERGR